MAWTRTILGVAGTTVSTVFPDTYVGELQIKGPRPWVDVRAYGAKGDGTTDDTTAIQAAIDAAEVSGGNVFVPPGTYIVSGLTIDADDVSLFGFGFESVLKLKNSTNADLLTVGGASNRVRNRVGWLILDGNKTNNLTSGRGLVLKNAGYSFVENLIITETRGHGLERDGSGGGESYWNNIDIRGSAGKGFVAVLNSPSGIMGNNLHAEFGTTNTPAFDFTNVEEVVLTNIFTSDNTGSGFFTSAADLKITNIYSQDNGGQGLDINAGVVTIAFGHVRRNDLRGVSLSNLVNGVVTGLTVQNSNEANSGTYKSDMFVNSCTRTRVYGNSLLGNVSTGFADHNIVLNGGTNNTVHDNYFAGATVAALGEDNSPTYKIYKNIGWTVENSGTGTILSGATTAVVTHGLSVTPTLDDISIVFGEQGTADYGRWWVDTITSTQFTLRVSVDPGASNLDFAWRAVAL